MPEDAALNRLLSGQDGIIPEGINEVKKYIRDVDANVLGIRNILEQSGFAHLAKLIDEDWLPGSILPRLQNSFRYGFMDWHLPYHGAEFEDFDKFGNAEIFKLLGNLRERVKRISRERALPEKIIEQFYQSLAAVVGLALNRALLPPYGEELVELLGAIVVIEASHWYGKRKPSEVISVPRFLANDTLEQEELREFKMKLHLHPHWIEEVNIAAVYKACACAQSRFLDLRRDAQFLIDIMRQMVEQELHETPVMPYVRGIAEKVIIGKTITHEAGRKQIMQGFAKAQYMEDFSAVLERTLKQWQITE